MGVMNQEEVMLPKEYLERERLARERSEFLDGVTVPRAASDRTHCQIATNLIYRFGRQLRDQPCHIYSATMRVKILDADAYVYPDVFVTCGEEILEDEDEDVLMNPVLVVEIVSESTEHRDSGRKLELYQSIESLKEYLLVSHCPQRIERYTRRSANEWLYTDFRLRDDIIRLESIDCELLMSDVYHKV